MKRNDFLLTALLFFIGFQPAIASNCDSCSVTANFSISNDTNSCNLIIDDLSYADSCSTFQYSIVDYGNGITDTIYPGQNITDVYSPGTYNVCLTAYAINYDSSGQYTICTDSLCTMITKDSCCSQCTIVPDFTVNENWKCELVFNETTTSDSCTTHLYSIVNYGNGRVDTIYPGDTIVDPYSPGTYDFCLTAYGVSYDAQGNPIYCDSTICEEVTKSICITPWRKKTLEKEESETEAKLILYPNPTNGIVNIELGNSVNQLRIISISGQIIRNIEPKQDVKYKVDLSDLPNGIYFIEARSVDKLITKKIIVN